MSDKGDERESLLLAKSEEDEENNLEDSGSVGEFPKSVRFIIGNEFCERFCFYGMKAILPLYLTGSMHFDQNRATTLIHSFNFSAYFFTLFGGIISDSLLGRYWTILSLSLLYSIGMCVLAGSSFPGLVESGAGRVVFFLGLLMVAFGTGGIKPCVSAFGGDQFRVDQVRALSLYFSVFYFAINAGSVLSMLLTPILRQNVHCFGAEDCYPLAFGFPSVLMFTATFIFVCGSALYIRKPPSSDASSIKVIKVIGSALLGRIKAATQFTRNTSATANPPSSWLEYADLNSYSREFIRETRLVLGIITVFAPISLFWALYDQQGSRWTYQAMEMNGKVSLLFNFIIKPEQMGVFNAILILLLIPAFDRFVYPTLGSTLRLNLQPLAKIFWGMTLAALSFVLAALLQFFIDSRAEGSVHMLWQIPQYLILTSGEVMVSITGLEFAYSQAPESMKAVCSAAWLLTVAFGNLVVIFINEIDPVTWLLKSHPAAWNFVLWAAILAAGTAGFAILAASHKFVDPNDIRTISSDSIEPEIEDKANVQK